MNKLITLFLIVVYMFQCGPYESYQTRLYIKNGTELTLDMTIGERDVKLQPEEMFTLIETEDRFNSIFYNTVAQMNTCTVSSDGTLLRTWDTEGRNSRDKQFFNEFSWYRGRETDGATYLTYTFIITPDDLGL